MVLRPNGQVNQSRDRNGRLKLLIDAPTVVYIAGFAVATTLLEVFMRYSRYASVLRWLTLSLFAYVGTVFVVGSVLSRRQAW